MIRINPLDVIFYVEYTPHETMAPFRAVKTNLHSLLK